MFYFCLIYVFVTLYQTITSIHYLAVTLLHFLDIFLFFFVQLYLPFLDVKHFNWPFCGMHLTLTLFKLKMQFD